jgi:CRISPR-associated endonuclease Cas1
MAACHTLSHSSAIPQISRLGVLTLYGYGIRVTMQAGHLQIEDGIGPERRALRLPRVNHRLKRLVCISEDGFVTLSALKWLSDIGASFVMLDRLGKVRVVTGPASPSEARLRRAQALALSNGMALQIGRELIAAKLTGQETLVREKLDDGATADVIGNLRESLSTAETVDAVRQIESHAAVEYWKAWHDVPILFPRKDAKRVPSHWLRFETRRSPLTGGPRLSVNPANSLLNYTNAVAESECRLAAAVCGLDPGIGFIHTDTANRDSLALDLIEVIRPSIEAWLLDWLLREPLRRSDFFETANGHCRISPDLCSKLSETAPTWGKLVAPWAEYVAHSLYSGRSRRTASVRGLKTPLTQSHRRDAKGARLPEVRLPKTEHHCTGCGKLIKNERENCGTCAVSGATERLENVARLGRVAAQSAEARAKHAESERRHAMARSAWDASSQPDWLTSEFFSEKVQPLLANISTSMIRSCIGVSRWYASKIRQGYRSHPRHWQALAELAGVQSSRAKRKPNLSNAKFFLSE